MRDGFVKVAAASPKLQVADMHSNAAEIIATAFHDSSVKVLITPQLSISSATCGDLYFQRTLQEGCITQLFHIATSCAELDTIIFVGLPIMHRGRLYNCTAALHRGKVLGFVPQLNPTQRFFSAGFFECQRLDNPFYAQENDGDMPYIGAGLLFSCSNVDGLVIAAEHSEDLAALIPPSTYHTAAGANVVVCVGADAELADSARHRTTVLMAHSSRLACAYLYSGAGRGESSTDYVYSGHNLIAENGKILASNRIFSDKIVISDIDLQRISNAKLAKNTNGVLQNTKHTTVEFSLHIEETHLTRYIHTHPFIPKNAHVLAQRCETVLAIQAAALQKRMEHIGTKSLVIGLSGGLDSTLALLVAVRTFSNVGWPLEGIYCVTMPGFGTTPTTLGNVQRLCRELDLKLHNIDITTTTRAHFSDISHNEEEHTAVYENAQARVRTLTLMDLANKHGALFLGTGDLSEMALGWTTFNGDHISMYGVNGGIPKTLIRPILSYESNIRPNLGRVISLILSTPVSPELLPATENGEISQKTEEILGSYDLHDFFLYYTMRWHFSPRKIFRLAVVAFGSAYTKHEIQKCMRTFYSRFFSQQFKRNCSVDGPAVGSVTLSPRGGWQMPSDAVSAAWLREVDELDVPPLKTPPQTPTQQVPPQQHAQPTPPASSAQYTSQVHQNHIPKIPSAHGVAPTMPTPQASQNPAAFAPIQPQKAPVPMPQHIPVTTGIYTPPTNSKSEEQRTGSVYIPPV